MSQKNPYTPSDTDQNDPDQAIPIVIKVVSADSGATLVSTDRNIRTLELREIDGFKDQVNKILGASNSFYRMALRVMGFGKKEPPVIFIINKDCIKPELLNAASHYISSLENDRYVFQLFVEINSPNTKLTQQGISPDHARSTEIINLMQNVATGFSKQKRRFGLERLAVLVTERITVFILIPLLIGLFSGIGEGFITRQVPNDRFGVYVDVLFYFLAAVSVLVCLFPFLLLVLFAIAIYRLLK